jgi:hypothetical protein
MQYDEYEAQRKAALREMAEYVDSAKWDEDRRRESIERLGAKYLLHPSNRVQRRVVPYGGVR